MALAERHPVPELCGPIAFQPGPHTYHVNGVRAPRSCTSVVTACFPRFKPRRSINAFFDGWRKSGRSKYESIIAKSKTSAAAKRAIAAQWVAAADVGRSSGSALHAAIEDELNEVPPERRAPLGDGEGGLAEQYAAFLEWRRTWAAERQLTPYRVELCVCWMRTDEGHEHEPALAGAIDALFVDQDGNYWMIDWKRARRFGPHDRHYDRFGYGPCAAQPDTAYRKYCFQMALYRQMLLKSTGIDVGSRRYLVRFGRDDPERRDALGVVDALHAGDVPGIDYAAAEALARLERGEPLLRAREGSDPEDEDDPLELWDEEDGEEGEAAHAAALAAR